MLTSYLQHEESVTRIKGLQDAGPGLQALVVDADRRAEGDHVHNRHHRIEHGDVDFLPASCSRSSLQCSEQTDHGEEPRADIPNRSCYSDIRPTSGLGAE